MGKFMKKSKTSGDFAVMDVSLGVRTRAKTLALQRLQSPPSVEAKSDGSPFSYLQLRSRRLEKIPPSIGKSHRESTAGETRDEKSEAEDLGVEASLGENDLDLDFEPRDRDRSTRESTPCSFIRDPNTVGTPGSTTRRSSDSSAANQRLRSDVQRDIPTSHEIEDFFACAEQHQQRLFMEKYNFDVVNDSPLSGHYDWVKLTP